MDNSGRIETVIISKQSIPELLFNNQHLKPEANNMKLMKTQNIEL